MLSLIENLNRKNSDKSPEKNDFNDFMANNQLANIF